MKKELIFSLIFLIHLTLNAQLNPTIYAETIESEDLKGLLYTYASDYFAGRDTGKKGQKIAVDFLRDYYLNKGITSAQNSENFFQKMILNIKGENVETENVVAIIPGNEKPNEYIILSAHLDHVGKENGKIYNGADDDGSGTVAILEIAEAFQNSVINGDGPKRSIVFLHVTGEEKGLLGSKFYTENPLYPLENTVANLNIDMIGRLDPKRVDKDPNYIYLIGSDRLSQELHDISEKMNSEYTNLKIDYTFNKKNDPNRFYFRSDHYNFAKKGIPIIFYFNGTHEDYHKPTDTPDKINYPLLSKRTKLIFYTAWKLANQPERIKLNN
tara:strand:+ start:3927 stop:4907 length:981 start_codon:yes stop_codon:yes gene_type:complete